MTFKYKNVYVGETATFAGPYEAKGLLKRKFDRIINDLYVGEKSWEKAEIKLSKESINILLQKIGKQATDINLIIAGDLLNQLVSSSYAIKDFSFPFLGIYSACANIMEGVIIAASMIDGGKIDNAIITTSSHNLSSEKQFRNPTEYGAPRPSTATFTATGGASLYLTNDKTDIKVEASTIGKIVDLGINDPNNMGAAMAPAAADTIYRHLKDLNRGVSYYDLILTGDLGIYGKKILIDYMNQEYNIDIKNNYDDCGTMLYNFNNQKEVLAGGSGPVCSALVIYSSIFEKMKKKELKKILLVPTGALFSPTIIYQKENILGIAHAVSMEVVE